MGLSRNVKAAIDAMVIDGLSRPQAAKRVGLADNSMYLALRNPQVLRYFNEQLEVLRTSERPRSVHKIAKLRDKAESERVQLDAAKYLDGGDKGAGVTVNVGIQTNITPGYMVDVSGHQQGGSQMLKLARSTRNVLDTKADVPTDEAGT